MVIKKNGKSILRIIKLNCPNSSVFLSLWILKFDFEITLSNNWLLQPKFIYVAFQYENLFVPFVRDFKLCSLLRKLLDFSFCFYVFLLAFFNDEIFCVGILWLSRYVLYIILTRKYELSCQNLGLMGAKKKRDIFGIMYIHSYTGANIILQI